MGSALRNRNRRRSLVLAAAHVSVACLGLGHPTRSASASASPLRFGTTPVFLDDRVALLGLWQAYLRQRTGREVVFVQRGSYREIVDLLLSDRVDIAWLCGYPYAMYEKRLALVAIARHRGQSVYRSHLIVPQADTQTRDVTGQRHRVFAFSDPLSNSGYLVPRVELLRAGQDPDRFFRRTFFTFGHRKVVEAVRVGLADAGAVDGYVWDTLHAQHPEETAGLRVAWRSAPHGFPPIVARVGLAMDERERLTRALLEMRGSASGDTLLQRLDLDGFERATSTQFDSIRELMAVPAWPRS